ncbi:MULTISPECIES: nitroreductase family protein [Jonquetella]|uniref:Nitroreductase n=1 Tax=Jonquetella anthropi DSM 22815 TaxID=885272 RepID=H0UMM7_9BACT|nr:MULTISPECIES: nitroreductase family protein [Jonquetella]EHM13730.1 nitroreductase [Jonquetella anthropi DSM 22815]
MEKKARTSYPINDLIARRWSPRAFDPTKAPGKEFILSLLEASRWAPSAYNAQPWRFIVASRAHPDEFQRLLDCLVPQNAAWAKDASLLLVALADTVFEHNGKPNPTAQFDLGLAVQNLLLETTSKGMFGHVMSGFDHQRVIDTFKVPETVIPVAMIALGFPGKVDALPKELQEAEASLRERKQVYEFTCRNTWGDNRGI